MDSHENHDIASNENLPSSTEEEGDLSARRSNSQPHVDEADGDKIEIISIEAMEEEPGETGTVTQEPREQETESDQSEDSEVWQQRYVRLKADFENFRRRQEKDNWRRFSNGRIDAIEKFLPIQDSFQRALEADVELDPQAYAEGVKLIHQQNLDALESLKITKIGNPGEPFDPRFHEAIGKHHHDLYQEDEIVHVVESGYIYADDVLVRPAKVIVSAGPANDGNDQDQGGEKDD